MNKIIETDIAIIGAGAAGLSAAYEAAQAGAKVLVIDENQQPGGQLFKQIHKFFGSYQHQAGVRGFNIGARLLKQVEQSGAKVLLNSIVYGLLPGKNIGLMTGGANPQNCRISPKKIIIAAGAKENYMAFPGSTLPGIMGAGAAQTMINVNRVLPGKQVLMVGSGNVGLIVSYQLLQAGANVLAVIEGAPLIGGYAVHAAKIRRAGVPILTGHIVTQAQGTDQISQVHVSAADQNMRPIPGTKQIFHADTLCLAIGLNPMTELAQMAGCAFTYIPEFGGHVPLHDSDMQSSVADIYVAGDITGVEEASSAMEEGRLAGVAAAQALGYLTTQEATAKKAEITARLETLRSGLFGAKRKAAKEKQLTAYQGRLTHER